MARPVNGNSKWQNSTFIMNEHTGASKKIMAIQSPGEFFNQLRRIAKTKGIQKNNGDHFGGELLALFGDHLFCECMTFFYI